MQKLKGDKKDVRKSCISKTKILVIGLACAGVLFVGRTVMNNILYSPRKEQPKGTGPRIVCIGDSITFGFGVATSRNQDAWVRILGRELEDRYEVLNYGICGATLLSESDQPYDPSFWQAAKDLEAQIYILMLGTNDSKTQNWNKEEYTRQLDERVKELLSISSVGQLYLMAPPPAFDALDNINGDVIRNEVYGIVKACAEQNNVGLIDLFTPMKDHPEYMMDGIHPNVGGNAVVAQTVLEALQQNP